MSYHEFVIGATPDEIVKLEITIPEPGAAERCRNTMSICGTTYDRCLIDDDTGEQMAMDSLSDGEIWRMCVEAGTTTMGLDEFDEHIMDADGWASVLGDITLVWDEDGKDWYARTSSGGQIDMNIQPEMFDVVNPDLTEGDLVYIWWCWKRYHMKELDKIPARSMGRLMEIIDRAEAGENNEIYYYRNA